MMQQQLQEWIQNPELLNKESLYELRKLLARYPYFQVARLLYLKNLYLLHDASFRDELRKSALFIADLSVLFYYIEGEQFTIRQKQSESSAETSSASDRTLDLIDRFLSDVPTAEDESLLPTVEASVDYTSILEQETPAEDTPSVPLKGQELIDSFIEKSESATEKLLPEDEISERPEKTEETTRENPNVKTTSGPVEEVDEESFFTETLAKIYVKQKRYDKALEIIRKLNLKYPKKNAYFADQIRFLKKLIINVNSK